MQVIKPKVLFIEGIINKAKVLENNYPLKSNDKRISLLSACLLMSDPKNHMNKKDKKFKDLYKISYLSK